MKAETKILTSVFIVFIMLSGSLIPICEALSEGFSDSANDDYVCRLECGAISKEYATVNEAVSYWNENVTGNCVITLYDNQTIEEDPIHIIQKKLSADEGENDRTLDIEGGENVVMKCSNVSCSGGDPSNDKPCVFYITAQSDFTQTPSLTFRNITFDLSGPTKHCCAIYSYGTDTHRYIRGVFADSCTFIGGDETVNRVAVETRSNGSADFTLYNCVGEKLHTLFNGYCFNRKNEGTTIEGIELKGLNVINCRAVDGKYFINNQAGEHSTLIYNCVAEFHGDDGGTDSYGIRTKGNSLYMEDVYLTYTGKSNETNYVAFVVAKIDKNPVKEMTLDGCVFAGLDVNTAKDPNDRRDIIIDGSGEIQKLEVNGSEITTILSDRYYNFPRYKVTVGSADHGSATVSDGNRKGTELSVMEGTKLTLSCEIDSGYVFDSWGIEVNAFDQFVMGNEPVTVSPSFKKAVDTCVVTVSGNIGGTFSQTTRVEYGTSFGLFAVPDLNYRILSVTIDGTDVGPVGMYIIDNIIDDVTVEITFEPTPGAETTMDQTEEDYGTKIVQTTTYYGEKAEKNVMIADTQNNVMTVATENAEGNSIKTVATVETESGEKTDVAEITSNAAASITGQIGDAETEVEAKAEVIIVAEGGTEMKTEIRMSCAFAGNLADGDYSLTIETNDGTMNLDNDVLETLSEDESMSLTLIVGLAEEEEVTPKEKELFGDSTIISAEAILTKSGVSTTIHDLNGNVRIRMPCEPKEGESYDKVTVYYYDDETGQLEKFDAAYDPEDKLVGFTTGHFSHFAVIFGELPEPKPVSGSYPPVMILAVLFAVEIFFIILVKRRKDDEEEDEYGRKF